MLFRSTLGQYFGYLDVAVIAITACAFGASGTYLLVGELDSPSRDASETEMGTPGETIAPDTKDILDARREEWEETVTRLANSEKRVYRAVLDSDGVLPQSEIVEQTDLSKATVSRTLDSLEAKDLVERKHRGMGNVVVLL